MHQNALSSPQKPLKCASRPAGATYKLQPSPELLVGEGGKETERSENGRKGEGWYPHQTVLMFKINEMIWYDQQFLDPPLRE